MLASKKPPKDVELNTLLKSILFEPLKQTQRLPKIRISKILSSVKRIQVSCNNIISSNQTNEKLNFQRGADKKIIGIIILQGNRLNKKKQKQEKQEFDVLFRQLTDRCRFITHYTLMKSVNPKSFIRKLEDAKLKFLTCIDLSCNSLSRKDIKHIVAADWKYLTDINMNFCAINNHKMSMLIHGSWRHLKSIKLMGNSITNDGVKNLTKSNWRQLEFISLQSNDLTNEAMKMLPRLSFYHLNKFKMVNKKRNISNSNSIAKLFNLMPQVGIELINQLSRSSNGTVINKYYT